MFKRTVPLLSLVFLSRAHVTLGAHEHLTFCRRANPYLGTFPAYVTEFWQLTNVTVAHWTKTLTPPLGHAQKTVSFSTALEIRVVLPFFTDVACVHVFHRFF